MEIKIFDRLPEQAAEIRRAVFMDEQHFINEFDDKESSSSHLLLFDKGKAVATCRVTNEGEGRFRIGRVAVIKERRGEGLGGRVVSAAERLIVSKGGGVAVIGAQVRAKGFYSSLGYRQTGDEYLDENCPHIMMVKQL